MKKIVKYLPHVSLLLGAIILPWYGMWSLLYGIFLLIWLLPPSLLILFIILIGRLTTKKFTPGMKYLAGLCLTVILAFGLVLIMGRVYDQVKYQTFGKYNEEVGNQVVAAVQKFERERYVPLYSLDELVPTYLPKYPTTKDGKPFAFSRGEKINDFKMRYPTDFIGMCYNDYDTHKWMTCDFGI